MADDPSVLTRQMHIRVDPKTFQKMAVFCVECQVSWSEFINSAIEERLAQEDSTQGGRA